jgi:hypothetical protein
MEAPHKQRKEIPQRKKRFRRTRNEVRHNNLLGLDLRLLPVPVGFFRGALIPPPAA